MKKQNHRTYLVCWEIEVIAASPTGAVRNALIIQRDSESIASVFAVSQGGKRWEVDLLAPRHRRARLIMRKPNHPRRARPGGAHA